MYNNYFFITQNIIHFLFNFIIIIVLIAATIFLLGFLLDYFKSTPYTIKARMTRFKSPGSTSDYYVNYWVWQRKKKREATEYLHSHGIRDVYYDHSKKRKSDENSRIPFRRRAFGKNN